MVSDRPRVELKLPARPSSPHAAREAMAELEDVLDARVLRDAQLLVSELVSNAIMHGPGGDILVQLTVCESGGVRAEVCDGGDGIVAMREIDAETRPSGDGGQGLRIVDSLAARWGVYPGSTHVWFELAGPGA